MNSIEVGEGPEIPEHVLIRRIGRGAYGEVWLAKNVIGGFRAVKIIYRGRFANERPSQREFEGICKFDPISRKHPGLVTILQVGQNAQAGYFYYVMELADDTRTGQAIDTEAYAPRTLKVEMEARPHRPLSTSLQIALSLTSALGYLHARGLIHRDIKPSNIIFVNGVPKIADVGLITEAGGDASRQGTPYYMPSDAPGEPTADIFALGKVFYELFMGLHPKHFPELPGAAEEFTTVPELLQVNKLILKACHHDHRQRFQTAEQLHQALLEVGKAVPGDRPSTGARAAGDSDSRQPNIETDRKAGLESRAGTVTPSLVGRLVANGEPQSKARWTRVAVLLVLLLVLAGGAFLGMNKPRTPVVVLMDTTAPDGTYDDENKRIGASNAKEVSIALEAENVAVTPHPEPLYAGWNRESAVIAMRPELVIIHRSSFHHSYNAVFNFGRATNGFARPPDDPKWWFLYNQLADDKLMTLLGLIGNEVPHTRFLIYSRGTDTNWLSDVFRAHWVGKIEERFPKLKGRVKTMVIPNGYNGSFQQPETRELLRTNVNLILKLPGMREPSKAK
jgi:hypothetical protein